MKKENKKEVKSGSSKKTNNKKTKKSSRKEFFSMLEEKVYTLGKKLLKDGLANIAIAQINNTEEKVKIELEQKYKEYKAKALQGIFLLIGIIFLIHGILSLIFAKLGLSEWTNIVFGIIFLLTYFLVKSKK